MLPSRTALNVSSSVDESTLCSVCTEPATDWAIGHCSHIVCGDCSHRMRVLYDRKTCVMCAATLPQVAVVPVPDYRSGMTFEEAVAIPGSFQDKQVAMWFLDLARCQRLKRARGLMCSHKACTTKSKTDEDALYSNPGQLRSHVRSEHRGVYCETCFYGRRSFVSELPFYTLDADRNYSSRLRGHLRKEHPQCKFCRHYYLDDEKLYSHLQDKHETCTICERTGTMHEYYVNYAELERHYGKQHYVCQDQGCRGEVFATEIELRTHQHTRHGDNNRNARNRALRVNLQQLHGDRDTRRQNFESRTELLREQERQAVRRQAFLSSNVVFSGAFNYDDASFPLPSETPVGRGDAITSSAAGGGSSTSTTVPSVSNTRAIPRAPDDGRFHPLGLPRDQNEMQARNAILVRSMRSQLDPAAYEQFRSASGQFHSGRISSDQYFDAVIEAFGVRCAIRDILPELVALLPTPLLREPLLQTCLSKTGTKASSVGYLGPSGGNNRSKKDRTESPPEQFPTLTGAPAPRRPAPAPLRRFGAPGPEEFPRLGHVNKPQVNVSTSAVPASSASGQSAYTSSVPARPVSVAKPPTVHAQKTAASVLRQAAPGQSRQQRGIATGGRGVANAGAQLSASAFPSLGSVAGGPTSRPGRHAQNAPRASNSSDEAPNADVAMRAGAVWGGVSARAHKKRGPGQGRGRIPAAPPKPVLLGSTDFPSIRAESRPSNVSTSLKAESAQGSTRQNAVIDVMKISQSRQKAIQQSSLPRVGGSGYGFVWDRKKVQQKKRQIKNDAGKAVNTSGATGRPGSSMTPQPSQGLSSNLNNNESVSVENHGEDETDLSSRLEDVEIEDPVFIPEQTSGIQDEPFDPYSYLKKEPSEDDVVASFLGRRR